MFVVVINEKEINNLKKKWNRWNCNKVVWTKTNCAFLGSHTNGILNSLLSHLNGSNHQTTTNYGRPFYDEASTTAKLEYQLRETEQLLEISLLKKKLRETERAMEQIIADIHGKAAKCNSDDESNASNTNDATMNVTTTQVRSSKKITKNCR